MAPALHCFLPRGWLRKDCTLSHPLSLFSSFCCSIFTSKPVGLPLLRLAGYQSWSVPCLSPRFSGDRLQLSLKRTSVLEIRSLGGLPLNSVCLCFLYAPAGIKKRNGKISRCTVCFMTPVRSPFQVPQEWTLWNYLPTFLPSAVTPLVNGWAC